MTSYYLDSQLYNMLAQAIPFTTQDFKLKVPRFYLPRQFHSVKISVMQIKWVTGQYC
jgi:hypothetical protein